MSEKIKNYLGIALIIGILVFSSAAVRFVGSYRIASSGRSFVVTGEGKAVSVPDVAQFTFGVITQGGVNVSDSQNKNTTSINKAIKYIKSQGVKKEDIKTQNYNITPRYQYFNCEPRIQRSGQPCPPPEIVGYTIRQTVLVKIRDFSKIGEIIKGVVEKGANTTSGLTFVIDDPADTENEARAKAITQAKEKAKAMAKATGFRLGKLLEIQESRRGIQPSYRGATLEVASFSDSAPAPTIEPGSQETRISVSLKYEIR